MAQFLKFLTIIFVIFLIIITILNSQYIGILFIDEIYGKYPTLNKLSAFGDSFGSINTLIS